MERKNRIHLLVIAVILILFGIVMIFSTSSIYAWEKYGDSMFFLKRQAAFACIGLVLAFIAMSVDYRKLRRFSRPLLIAALVLLVAVLIPGLGRQVSGAQRWFRFKFLSFQPSEFAAFAVIFYLADFIARRGRQMRDLTKGYLPALAVLGLTSALILMQPDLGSTLAIASVVMLMLFSSGVRFSYIVSTVLVSLPALYVLIFAVPYRRARILAFLNPWLDPKGSGFQIIQSQIALGSGGLFGVGLGHSKQKLFYLPAAHTDFIFSIIGEELGLIGTLGVIILFACLLFQARKILAAAGGTFDFFLGLGLTLMIAVKAVINIGVSCGLFPTKGLPLPLISYGGSSLIFDMMSIGVLMNIARTGEYP